MGNAGSSGSCHGARCASLQQRLSALEPLREARYPGSVESAPAGGTCTALSALVSCLPAAPPATRAGHCQCSRPAAAGTPGELDQGIQNRGDGHRNVLNRVKVSTLNCWRSCDEICMIDISFLNCAEILTRFFAGACSAVIIRLHGNHGSTPPRAAHEAPLHADAPGCIKAHHHSCDALS